MTTQTMGPRDEEFILSEAPGQLSRTNATLASGQNLVSGTVVQDNGSGKMIVASGALNTAGDAVTTAVAGILCRTTDATDGDLPIAIIDKDAEVKDDFLTYPTETTAGGEKAATIDSLLELGIKVRTEITS